jgi:GNAT superfamily N-acetyltransferase
MPYRAAGYGDAVDGMVIRTGAQPDLLAVRGVFRRSSLANAGDRGVLLAHPDVLIWAGGSLRDGRTRVAVDAGGTIVGFATVVPEDGFVELDDLFVEPRLMRRGIARALVADAVERARAAGFDQMRVTANDHAMAFYRAVGFVPDGTAQTRFEVARRLRLDIPHDIPAVGGLGGRR